MYHKVYTIYKPALHFFAVKVPYYAKFTLPMCFNNNMPVSEFPGNELGSWQH